MNRNTSLRAVLIIAIIVAINLVSQEFHFRLDLTEDREYTLSNATRSILSDLEDVVTVKAYFSESLPPQYASIKQEFQETLLEYADRSDGKLVFEFINPGSTEQKEEEAVKAGVQPLMIDVREKDQMKQQKVYLGAVVSMGDKSEVIPYVRPGYASEFALSRAIKKISDTDKPAIGFLQGHGEAPLAELIEVGESLEVMYTLQEVTLTDSTGIPDNIATLAIVRPKDSIPVGHFEALERFMARGGKLLVAINRVEGDLQNSVGIPVTTGLETWLKEKGVEIEDNFVIDARCASIPYQFQTSIGVITQQIEFPFLPVIANFSKHPITEGLEAVVFQFASNLKYTGDTTRRFMPIAFTSEKSGLQKLPVMFDPQHEWTEAEFPQQLIPVAGALEGKISGDVKTRMVVIADGDFPINGPRQQARRIQPDNINLFVNSVDWLSDDTGLIELRTKGASARPIRQLEDTTKTVLKYTNFLLPLLLAIGYGIWRFQRNRSIQMKRMSEDYDA